MSKQLDGFNEKIKIVFKEIQLVKQDNESITLENKNLAKETIEITKKLVSSNNKIRIQTQIQVIRTTNANNENCVNIVNQIGKKMYIELKVLEARRVTREITKTSVR